LTLAQIHEKGPEDDLFQLARSLAHTDTLQAKRLPFSGSRLFPALKAFAQD
jgi:hypothetical protein